MKKLTSRTELCNSVKNLKKFNKKAHRLIAVRRIQYVDYNQTTTSPFLNEHLYNLITAFSNPKTPVGPLPKEITLATHQSLLKSACSSDADLLSYKGINLGSAINMKLAVKLGSLLGKQQG